MSNDKAYWLPGADYSSTPFFIRRTDTLGHIRAAGIPAASVPLTAFVYLTGGEMLVETGEGLFHLSPGHLLLIPEKSLFSVSYYQDARGYTGGFSSAVADKTLLPSRPLHHAFWFDEASFVGELFNMMTISFEQGRMGFISHALGLLLGMLNIPASTSSSPRVSAFLESIFDPAKALESAQAYAREAGMTENGFARMVRRESGRSPGAWIAAARVNRSKRLLQDTDMSIIDVAAAVGCEDQSYFTRFFRLHTGMTPNQYRHLLDGRHKKS